MLCRKMVDKYVDNLIINLLYFAEKQYFVLKFN